MPCFADRLVGREAFEGLESSAEVISGALLASILQERGNRLWTSRDGLLPPPPAPGVEPQHIAAKRAQGVRHGRRCLGSEQFGGDAGAGAAREQREVMPERNSGIDRASGGIERHFLRFLKLIL